MFGGVGDQNAQEVFYSCCQMWSNFSGRCLPSSVAHRKPVHSLCIKYSWFSDPLQWQLADTLVFVSQEEPAPTVQGRRSSLSGVCYLTMGLLVLLLGLVFASMYVYRYFFITQVGASLEGLLVLQLEQPDKPLQPLKEMVLFFIALHCGNLGACPLGTAVKACLKWWAQAHVRPDC